jgi:basic amino acid/polyamine antiporter, APA family
MAGSAYTYAYATLGQLFAWIIGWDLILEYLFGASLVAVGWSGYVVSFLKDFGIVVPDYLCNAPFVHTPGAGWSTTGAVINLPAMLIILAVATLVVLGIRESVRFNNIIVFVKIGVLLLFIIFGSRYVSTDNWTPFIPENTGTFGQYGWSGVVRGAAVIFLAYLGFDCVSTLAQEARNPQRDMPIAILGSLGIATIFYILVAFVLTGIVSYTTLNVPDPIAVAVNAAGEGLFWLRKFIKIGAIAGLSSVILVLMLGQPRIFYSMAYDGLLPQVFARIHPRFHTPYVTSIVCGVVVAIVAGLLPIGLLGELISVGTLLAFVIVCLWVLALRFLDPDASRPFKVPFVTAVSLLGAGIALVQMLFLPVDTWIRLLAWMAIGLVIYFGYGARHSRVGLMDE